MRSLLNKRGPAARCKAEEIKFKYHYNMKKTLVTWALTTVKNKTAQNKNQCWYRHYKTISHATEAYCACMCMSQRLSVQTTSSLTWAGQVKSSTPSRCGEKSDLTKPHRQALLWPAHEGEKIFSNNHLKYLLSCSQTFTSFTSSLNKMWFYHDTATI